jgi:hypothetical protein
VVDSVEEVWAGVAGVDSGGRRAGSLSLADLDRWFAVRRSAMDYAIGRQAGGGSDGIRLGRKKRALMDNQVPQLGVRLRCFRMLRGRWHA